MPLALKGLAMETPGRVVDRLFTVVPSGNYTTGGDTLDFTTLVTNGIDGIKNFSRLPLACYPLTDPAGYYVEIIPGTTLKNWLVRFFTPGGVELTGAAAYPAALLNQINGTGGVTSPTPLIFESRHIGGK